MLLPRMPRCLLVVAIIALATFLSSCSEPAPRQVPPPPPPPAPASPAPDLEKNIVLIVLDAVRADRLHAERSGMPLMPKLRAFAEKSQYFPNAFTQATWTKPSMTTVFTSLYPEVHQVQRGIIRQLHANQTRTADKVQDSFEVMAEVLKGAGYSTAAIQVNGNLRPIFGFGQGFDTYDCGPDKDYDADALTRVALEQTMKMKPPFFLYTHYMDAHGPYTTLPEYLTIFGQPPAISEQEKQMVAFFNKYYVDRILVDNGITNKREQGEFSPTGRDYIRQAYDSCCRCLDDYASALIDSIQKDHPNTLFIIMADHGEEFWEHGSIGHAKTVYEELARVLLILHSPTLPPQHCEAPVELLDLLPTAAAYAGIPPRPEWQGRDILNTSNDPMRPVYTQTRSSLFESKVNFVAVRQGNFKLIVDENTQTASLYDLAADPLEAAPIDNPEKKAELARLITQFHEKNALHPLSKNQQEKQSVDGQVLEQLNSQGYF